MSDLFREFLDKLNRAEALAEEHDLDPRPKDPIGEVRSFLAAMATAPAGATSLAAELLRNTGLMDEDYTSVITGETTTTRPELEDIPGTWEWTMKESGYDPYAPEALLGSFLDPASAGAGMQAILGPALRKLIKETGDLPKDMQWLEDSPRYIAELSGKNRKSWGGETHEIFVDPVVPENWESVPLRGTYRTSPHYDPNEIEPLLHYNPNKVVVERNVRLTDEDGLPMQWQYRYEPTADVARKPKIPENDDMAWRGMSWEEMRNIEDTGRIESNQSMNIGGQVDHGTTSFGERPDQARIYATDFAHLRDRPTPNRPAYMVGVKRENLTPVEELQVLTPGEINALPVEAENIEAVYRADPIAMTPTKTEIYRDSMTGNEWAKGSSFAGDTLLDWRGVTPKEQAELLEELAKKLRELE